ncbi:hypothetical protein K4749_28430 [Streptomyces sp. TRM72054]|uniref:hypothetical protein n=1 Tax=Streptomyces sp. TRM72054 TaxID=2870562 RepID=UPI001C8B95C1|nr:hypothetical protein [Streptomyces sp. TRM72054]MBX9397407.1 hypothetical protein [Streptomyces sp. TRM72054]
MPNPGLTRAELARRLNDVRELHLTDAGWEALRAADAVIVDIERQITDELGPKETAVLRALLDRVADTVRNT